MLPLFWESQPSGSGVVGGVDLVGTKSQLNPKKNSIGSPNIHFKWLIFLFTDIDVHSTNVKVIRLSRKAPERRAQRDC